MRCSVGNTALLSRPSSISYVLRLPGSPGRPAGARSAPRCRRSATPAFITARASSAVHERRTCSVGSARQPAPPAGRAKATTALDLVLATDESEQWPRASESSTGALRSLAHSQVVRLRSRTTAFVLEPRPAADLIGDVRVVPKTPCRILVRSCQSRRRHCRGESSELPVIARLAAPVASGPCATGAC